MMNNPYATLPHPQPPPNPEQRAKIKVIGVITNMFTATRQANIFEEESNYLEYALLDAIAFIISFLGHCKQRRQF